MSTFNNNKAIIGRYCNKNIEERICKENGYINQDGKIIKSGNFTYSQIKKEISWQTVSEKIGFSKISLVNASGGDLLAMDSNTIFFVTAKTNLKLGTKIKIKINFITENNTYIHTEIVNYTITGNIIKQKFYLNKLEKKFKNRNYSRMYAEILEF